ncbi:hypothetical protein KR51_00019790 [Rubidibacter lacunae KORDI 51-2]|uniref:Uncharacterized protein n=1 Tax=Rubidibacter lacunae KORDI 51-2 TaxID=582515 RepID=U5DNX7_9CHRO|nr:hypothetical protein KR51_00019790 [Rubidibacter lacunae KORDI 51-2]
MRLHAVESNIAGVGSDIKGVESIIAGVDSDNADVESTLAGVGSTLLLLPASTPRERADPESRFWCWGTFAIAANKWVLVYSPERNGNAQCSGPVGCDCLQDGFRSELVFEPNHAGGQLRRVNLGFF